MNPLLFPPALIKRALDDLSAIGDAARRLPVLEAALFARVDGLTARIDGLTERIDGLREEMAPIGNLSAVRTEIEAMRSAVEPLSGQLDSLRGDVQPIQQLADVRKGIEPLDSDMREVREAIDELEPMIEKLGGHIVGIDAKLDEMRGDLSPLGDLAGKFPGIGR